MRVRNEAKDIGDEGIEDSSDQVKAQAALGPLRDHLPHFGNSFTLDEVVRAGAQIKAEIISNCDDA